MAKYSPQQIAVIKEIANDNITHIMDLLGILGDLRDRKNYINGACPIHKGDNKTSFSWSYNISAWKCFTHKCESKVGADVYGLIMAVKQLSFFDAIDWIVTKLDINLDEIKVSSDNIDNTKFIMESRRFIPVESKEIDISVFNRLHRYYDIADERGFDKSLCDKFDIKIGSKEFMNNRLVIPVKNKNNIVVGFTCRDLTNKSESKWLHYGFESGNVLFNINNALPTILDTNTAILTEGPLDVIKLEAAGITNGLAVFGDSLSYMQLPLLLSCNVFTVILALDNDEAGKNGARITKELISNYFNVQDFKIPENYKDIGEMPLEEIQKQYNIMIRR